MGCISLPKRSLFSDHCKLLFLLCHVIWKISVWLLFRSSLGSPAIRPRNDYQTGSPPSYSANQFHTEHFQAEKVRGSQHLNNPRRSCPRRTLLSAWLQAGCVTAQLAGREAVEKASPASCLPVQRRSSSLSLSLSLGLRWGSRTQDMMLLPSSGVHGHREDSTVLIMGEPSTEFQLTKEMVMEKPSPLLVGREFVRQYYTLLNQAPDFLHRFYGKSSSYVHGGLDSSGKPVDAVYGQTDIHKKVMSLNFKDCRTKIRHVDAHATLNDGVVVQVMGELSNNRQPMRRFMQTFVLAPEGSVANKFYVHNDIFRYQDEVFGDSDTEPPEESDEEVDEPEERQQTPEVAATDDGAYYDQTGTNNDLDEPLEEQIVEPEPEPEPEPEQEPEPEVTEEKCEPVSEEPAPEEEEVVEKSPSPLPADPAPAVQEDSRAFSWASVTSKNLPPSGAVPVSGIPPHVVKVQPSQPRPEVKTDNQTSQRPPQRDQRVREQRITTAPPRGGPRPVREGEQGELETRRINRYPDSHQLFVGNLPHDVDRNELKEFFQTYGTVVELRINSGGKLPNFGFVVFDDAEPVQKILSSRPIMFRGDVRLNVEEKKTRAAREGDRRGERPRGIGGPRGGLGGGLRGPPRGAMSQKPGFGAGRGVQGPRQ